VVPEDEKTSKDVGAATACFSCGGASRPEPGGARRPVPEPVAFFSLFVPYKKLESEV
jgi:hypothetical protein